MQWWPEEEKGHCLAWLRAPVGAKARPVGLSARAQESTFIHHPRELTYQNETFNTQDIFTLLRRRFPCQWKGISPVTFTYKNGNLCWAQSPVFLVLMSHLIYTPVTENQMWEHFIVLGKQNETKMDTSVPEVVNRANSCVSWQSKQEKILIAVGFCCSPLQILVIFEFRLVSCFCSMLTAGLHTWALFPIDCLQGEEGKYQRPCIVQIPWLEPVGEKGRGKYFKILVSVHFEGPLQAALTTWVFK